MQTEYGESMQRLQFSRSLAFFSQNGMREQSPDVMCNAVKQITIIRSIDFAVKLLAQRNKRSELPLGTDGETERCSHSHQGIACNVSSGVPPNHSFLEQDWLITFLYLQDDR